MRDIAHRVIEKCGGAQRVADLLGIHFASVHKWRYPLARGGTGGLIPTARQQELLQKARAAGIDLSPDDFFETDTDGLDPAPADDSEPDAA